jgi:hypothetical protein
VNFTKRSVLRFLLIILLFSITAPVYANVIWPSLYIAEGLRIWWIILIGLLIEFIFVKIFTKDSYLKSALMTIVMNIISTLIGIIAIPLIGFVGEAILYPLDEIFGWSTFDIPHWIFSFFLTVLCNTAIEALALKIIFKKIYKKIFLWLFIANSFSVIISILKMYYE